MSTCNVDSLLKDLSIKSAATEVPVVIVDSEDKFIDAVKEVSAHSRVAFDAEGVNLGRTGELTIATFQGFDGVAEETPIYVVDVEVLGGDRVFSKTLPSFRSLLEDSAVTKVTFDCRSDSDALFHQFGVSLAGVLDLQVFDQAVRIHQGELPPKKNIYFEHGGVPLLSGMEKVLSRYSAETAIGKSSAPHKRDSNVWKKRPLSVASVKYAGNDVNVIKILWEKMNSARVPTWLMEKVILHSKRYEGMFRDKEKEVHPCFDKDFVMEEHGIIIENELPSSHPRKPRKAANYTEERWQKAVMGLHSKQPNAYNDVLFVLQHNDWYTEEARKELKRLSLSYPFTVKQRNSIANPPALIAREDSFEGDYYGDY